MERLPRYKLMTTEQRHSDRLRAFLGAKIVFNGGNSVVDVTIRNLSETGAKIELDMPTSIPDQFELSIPAKSRSHNAEVRWRRIGSIGVQFID